MNKYQNVLHFLERIGMIMYVGGILSHIVIGATNANPSPENAYLIYTYKLNSAYFLILPGLAIKVLVDIIELVIYRQTAWWMRIKLAMVAFLTINAFVFMLPMMPEVLAIAKQSIGSGTLPPEFFTLEHKEQMVGMSNILPLIIEMLMGHFRPAPTKREKRHSSMSNSI